MTLQERPAAFGLLFSLFVNFLLIFKKMVVKDAFNWVRIWRLLF